MVIFLLLISFSTVLLGLLVYLRDKQKALNKLFFLLACTAALWTLASYFGGHIGSLQISNIIVHLDYALGLCMTWSFMLFAISLNTQSKNGSVLKKTIFTSSILLTFALTLSFTSKVLGASGPNGELAEGPWFTYLYLIPQAVFIFTGIGFLIKARLSTEGIEKNRVSVIMSSLVVCSILLGLPYLVLDNIGLSEGAVRLSQELGNLGLLVFVVGSAYAIIKHHLFDIRATAARATTYVLSLVTIGLSYILVAFVISENALVNMSESTQRVFYTTFSLATALLYQPIKKFFDKITSKIFYRDSYTTEQYLDELSDILVASYESADLIANITRTTTKFLKSSSVDILLSGHDGNNGDARLITLQQLVNEGVEFPLDIPILDSVTIKRKLAKMNISAAFLLQTKTNTIGFMTLGEKRSGQNYTAYDIKNLSIASGEIALALENALRFQEIEDLNTNLQEKIDDATQELKRSNNKLKALDEAKDEFISMASHQLRTPLTSIKGYLSMVLEGDVGEISSQQKDMLNTAYASAQRMVYLIADLLNVSRLQTGKFMIEPVDCYLPDVVSEELAQLKEAAAGKNIIIKYDKPLEFPTLKLDETKIRQVIMNFADNALYYTPAGGEVEIKLSKKQKSVEFTVTDNGIGVPKAEQHKLFAKFYRAGNARKARPDGTGLGLFMARKVVVASGGAIIFKSKEGKGSTFGFTFPY